MCIYIYRFSTNHPVGMGENTTIFEIPTWYLPVLAGDQQRKAPSFWDKNRGIGLLVDRFSRFVSNGGLKLKCALKICQTWDLIFRMSGKTSPAVIENWSYTATTSCHPDHCQHGQSRWKTQVAQPFDPHDRRVPVFNGFFGGLFFDIIVLP